MFPFSNIKSWYDTNFCSYVLVKQSTSEVILSKALFQKVCSDHPTDKSINVMFTRITDPKHRIYAMFFNPDWQKHSIDNPHQIMTVPVTLGNKGHIGFQAIQPSVAEIVMMYGIKSESDDTFVRINVSREHINGEPYYRLIRP